jgi:uncharacterized protein with GYD domain
MIAGGRYLSSDDPMRVFAAGSAAELEVAITWRSGKRSVIKDAKPNYVYEIDESAGTAVQSLESKVQGPGVGASERRSVGVSERGIAAGTNSEDHAPRSTLHAPSAPPLFEDISSRLKHIHVDVPFDDFARQPLLPHKLSTLGPGGWATLAEKPERLFEVTREVESMGLKVVAQYALFGQWDFLNIIEAPDEGTMARAAVTLAARGTMRSTTLSLREKEFVEAARSLGASNSRIYNLLFLTQDDDPSSVLRIEPSFRIQYGTAMSADHVEERSAEAAEVIVYLLGQAAAEDTTVGYAEICGTPAQAQRRDPPEAVFEFIRDDRGAWRLVDKDRVLDPSA